MTPCQIHHISVKGDDVSTALVMLLCWYTGQAGLVININSIYKNNKNLNQNLFRQTGTFVCHRSQRTHQLNNKQ